jgi:hypothetical protein
MEHIKWSFLSSIGLELIQKYVQESVRISKLRHEVYLYMTEVAYTENIHGKWLMNDFIFPGLVFP